MSVHRRIAVAVVATWINRFIAVALGLVFIRVLFKRLNLEEQGFWVLLGNSAMFVGLLDLGIMPTLTRRIALARGKSGADTHATLTPESKQEIADLTATGARLYRTIAVMVFIVSTGLGFIFLSNVKYHDVDKHTVWLAWFVLCLGYAINVWGQIWQCSLAGLGVVGWTAVVDMVMALLTIITQIILVWNGGGILQMAIVVAVGGLLGRQISLMMMRRMYPELFKMQGRWSSAMFRSLVSPALRAWLTFLGAFMILKMDQYFITLCLDAAQLPKYNACYQIVSNMYMFAVTIALGSTVFISHLWQAGELKQVHAVVKRSARMGMILMVCGVACVAVAGKPLMELWLGEGNFVGYPILWTFCIMLTLEAHHVIIAACSRATEDEAFAGIAMLAGAFNLILGFTLVHLMGLWGVALGTLIAQLTTNNWYAVYRGLRRLKMSIREHATGVILPTAIIFLITLGLAYGATRLAALLPATSPMVKNALALGFAAGISSAVLAIALWKQGLSPDERTSFKGIIRRRLKSSDAAAVATGARNDAA